MVVIRVRQVTALVGAQAYLLEYKFRAAVVVVGHRAGTLASPPPVVLVVLAVGEIPVLLPPLVELLVMPVVLLVLVVLAVGQGAQQADLPQDLGLLTQLPEPLLSIQKVDRTRPLLLQRMDLAARRGWLTPPDRQVSKGQYTFGCKSCEPLRLCAVHSCDDGCASWTVVDY